MSLRCRGNCAITVMRKLEMGKPPSYSSSHSISKERFSRALACRKRSCGTAMDMEGEHNSDVHALT